MACEASQSGGDRSLHTGLCHMLAESSDLPDRRVHGIFGNILDPVSSLQTGELVPKLGLPLRVDPDAPPRGAPLLRNLAVPERGVEVDRQIGDLRPDVL